MSEDLAGWSGFATAALSALGKSAPWVVIGGLAAFGVYKLDQLNQTNFTQVREVAQQERQQARDDFSAANTALKETYGSVKQLFDGMLSSFREQLAQLNQLELNVRNKQKELFDSQLAAETTLVKLTAQKAELDRQKSELDAITEQVKAEKTEAAAARAEREAAEVEVRDLKASLEAARQELLNTRLVASNAEESLKAKRAELDQAVTRVRDTLGVLEDVASISGNISSDELRGITDRARKIVPQLDDFLAKYRDAPTARTTLEIGSLVGAKLSDLRAAMHKVDGVSWYVAGDDRKKAQLSIIGVAGDQTKGNYLSNALRVSFTYSDQEELLAYLEGAPISEIDSVVITAAELASGIYLSCVDGRNFKDTIRGGVTDSYARWGPSDSADGDVEMTELLSIMGGYGQVSHINSAPSWRVKVFSPEQAWAEAPEIARQQISGYWGPRLCLALFGHRKELSDTVFTVAGMSDEENKMLGDEVNRLYREVIGPNQNFTGPVDFDVGGSLDQRALGSFVSQLAVSTLQEGSVGSSAIRALAASPGPEGGTAFVHSANTELAKQVDLKFRMDLEKRKATLIEVISGPSPRS